MKSGKQWAAYNYIHEKSYYPVVPQATYLNALPRMSHLKATRKLRERDLMLEPVSFELTVKLSGNEPCINRQLCSKQAHYPRALNMYATSVQPKEKLC